MLCAVDDRPLVSVPVVIVSTTRQGGCTCENISGLRMGTYNLEFTALHAPKPLLLISADDATRTMPEQGFPELQQHYSVLGAKHNVSHAALLQFPHNYNIVSRAVMYGWLNQHLRLGLDEPILERSYQRLTREQLTVWGDEHPRPESDPEFEHELLERWKHDAQRQLAALIPHDQPSLRRYREIVGGGWDVLLRGLPEFSDVHFMATKSDDRGDHRRIVGLLRYRTMEDHQAELPIVRLSPKEANPRTVIWIDPQGKSGLFTKDGSIKPPVQRLLDAGMAVVGVDLLLQGEFIGSGTTIDRQPCLPGEEAFAGWTYCYNMPTFARRVHDILAVIAHALRDGSKITSPSPLSPRGRGQGEGVENEEVILEPSLSGDGATREVDVVGLDGTGRWIAGAVAQARGAVARAAIDTGGFRFSALQDVYHVDFLPGGARYGDLPGLLALSAPTPIWLAGEGRQAPPIVRAAFTAAGSAEKLTMFSDDTRDRAEAAVDWLLSQ
jgi:hypothetical protein